MTPKEEKEAELVRCIIGRPDLLRLLNKRQDALCRLQNAREAFQRRQQAVESLNHILANEGVENFDCFSPELWAEVVNGTRLIEHEMQVMARILRLDGPEKKKDGRKKAVKEIDLGALQAESRARHQEHPKTQPIPISPIPEQNTVVVASDKYGGAERNWDFKRPPAVYSNKSPYGIATEMLMKQMQEDTAKKSA